MGFGKYKQQAMNMLFGNSKLNDMYVWCYQKGVQDQKDEKVDEKQFLKELKELFTSTKL